ncbi:sensor histidine kinase [candidate division KSB1 bacterium]
MKILNKKQLRNFSLLLFFFTFVAVFFASESYLISIVKDQPINILSQIQWTLVRWLPWAFFTPLIVYFIKRFPVRREKWFGPVLFHLVLSVFFTVIQAGIYNCFIGLFKNLMPVWNFRILSSLIFGFIHFNIIAYGIVISIYYLFEYYRKFRERELKASRLETRLAQSQLEVLKMQLQPHFLFNTLHAISALLHKDSEAADKMISRLSDLLRFSLDNSGLQEVTLKEELELLKIYLEIEKTRFEDRLNVKYDIARETLSAVVPNLILQPLVENAVRHGIAPNVKGGMIKISSRHENNNLVVEVYDNGIGLKKNDLSALKKGFGLANTIERLNQLYGERGNFNLENAEGGGTIGTFKIPFRIVFKNSQK